MAALRYLAGAGSGGGGGSGGCDFDISLRTQTGKTVYAILYQYIDGVLYIFKYNTMEWMTVEEFNTNGYTAYDAQIVLTENPHAPGNYFINVPGFTVGDGSTPGNGMFIDYADGGGVPELGGGTGLLGTQYGYWSDTECKWYDNPTLGDINGATTNVQNGDYSNQNLGLNAEQCCRRIANIEALVRQIYYKTGNIQRGKQ